MANELTVTSIGNYLNNTNTRKFLETMLKDRVGSFITSLVSMQNLNKNLQGCEPNSLMMCGLKAASLNLPLDPNLGQAYPVPFKNKKQINGVWETVKEATFQIGYKGLIQLAMRTGQYKKIILTDIRAGEVVKIDPLTETYEFAPILDEAKRDASPVVGYYFAFELVNGFFKPFYSPIGKLLAHAKRYSKSFSDGPWQTNQDEMCRKTMIRLNLPKWGPMSIEMQEALQADQAVLRVDETTGQELPPEYIDSPNGVVEGTVVEGEVIPATEDEEFAKFKAAKENKQPDVFEAIKEASK
jgi:recombination protein RecT